MSIEPYVRRALELATAISHPVYDCLYLALAEHLGTHVVTDDRRFFAAGSSGGLANRIRLLGT